jgi:hypothetical protein
MMKIFRDKNVLIKGQGDCVKIRRKNHGWSNWGLQYQPRQVCQAGQVHKIREQILSTCVTTFEVFRNLRKFLKKRVWSRYSKNSKTSLTCLEIFMQNGKVGEGDVFSKKTSLLP